MTATEQQTQQQVTPKTFYCVSPHYAACVNPGTEVFKEGKVSRFGEKHLTFSPMLAPDRRNYGVMTTSDPEKIQWIEEQIAQGNPDFFTPDTFFEHTTPPEEKARQWKEAATASMRELQVRNKLLEDLRERSPEVYAKVMEKQKK